MPLYAEWSSNDKIVLTSGKDSTIRTWDPINGLLINTICCVLPKKIAWSSNTAHLLTISHDIRGGINNSVLVSQGKTQLWDLNANKELIQLTSKNDLIKDIKWVSKDGLVLIQMYNKIAVWNVSLGEEVTRLIGHQANITKAIWSPSGFQILTASSDGTIRIWSSKSGNEITRIIIGEPVKDVRWSDDGKRIFSVSDQNTVRLHYANIEDLIAVAKTYVTRELTCRERVQYLSEERDCTAQP